MPRTKLSQWVLCVLLISLSATLLTACGNRKQVYYDRGVKYFETGDIARARLELKNALQIDGKFAPGWYWLGRVEEQEKNFRTAFADFNRAVELDPNYVAAHVRMGEIYVLANDLTAASQAADKALSITPHDADALLLRAAVRQRTADAAGAKQDIQAVLQSDPGHAAALTMLATLQYQQGDQKDAVATIEQAVQANPTVPRLRLLLGRYYHETGNTAGAMKVLQELITSYPDKNEYPNLLATYLMQQGQGAEAEKVLRAALAQAPADSERQKAVVTVVKNLRGADAALAEIAALRAAHPDSLSLRFLDADLQLALRHGDRAEKIYQEIITETAGRGPDAIRARIALASILPTTRQQEAEQLLTAVLKDSPKEFDALQLRAALALRSGQPDQAIADLRSVLHDDPARLVAQRMLGQAHALKGEAALAEEAFDKAIKLAPKDATAYLQLAELRARGGDAAGAITMLERLLTQVPDSEVAQQAIANIQFSSRDWEALDKTIANIKQTHPTSPLGYHLEGTALQLRGKHKAAIKAFSQALQLAPKSIESMSAMVRSQLASGQGKQAEQLIRNALKNNPDNVIIMNLLGEIYLVTKQPEQAHSIYEKAIQSHPESPQAYSRLATLEELAGHSATAIKLLQQGATATQNNVALLFQLGTVFERAGQTEQAIGVYNEALQHNPDAEVVINNLAILLTAQHDQPQALERAFKLAQRFADSKIPEYLDTLGWIYYLRSDYNMALPLLEKAVAQKAQLGELQYHLGMTYAKLKRTEPARQHLTLATQADKFAAQHKAHEALQALLAP